ncbi:hypothetical protein D3C84_683490 [compost metagenome]
MCIGAPVVALGAKHGQTVADRVAHLKPLPGLTALGDLVQLVLFASRPQPSADVFGQDDNGPGADQALRACLGKVGGQLAVQALQVLVITGEQLRLNPQQVAMVGGGAFAQGQLDPQVRQVMPARPLLSPEPIATQRSNDNQRQGA